MRENSSSDEIVKFMALYAKLRDWTDNDSEGLRELAQDDQLLMKLCHDLLSVAYDLKMAEDSQKELFTAPTNRKFQESWREFESRFASSLESICDRGPLIFRAKIFTRPVQHAEVNASHAADLMEETFAFAEFASAHEVFAEYEVPGYSMTAKDLVYFGRSYWQNLKDQVGIDVEGVFRRRAMVPFVLVPKHISDQISKSDKLSMLNNLQEAQNTFVQGYFLASLSLLRSTMEAVLRDYYRAEGTKLADYINWMGKKGPRDTNADALRRIKKTANDVLHLDPDEQESPFMKLDPTKLEAEILSSLIVVRNLIERAPNRST